MDPTSRVIRIQSEPVDEHCFQSRAHDLTHQRRGSVVAAARAPLLGLHDALENAAKHVWGDELSGIVLPDGEVESFEEIVERGAPIPVAPDGGTATAFERGRLEQAAVEEWDRPKRSRGGATPISRPIQRTEAEGVEKGAVKVPARREGPIEESGHIAGVAIEPALRLDEIKEEHAGERRQRERMAIRAGSRRAQAIGEPVQSCAKRPEEAGRDALAGEHVRDSKREGERRFALCRRQSFQRRQARVRRARQRDRREPPPQSNGTGGAHEASRLAAQRTCQPPLGAGRQASCGDSPRLFRVGCGEREHAERSAPRNQRCATDSGAGCGRFAKPRPGWYHFPRRLVAERHKQLSEIVDLLGAGENVAQHQNPSLKRS